MIFKAVWDGLKVKRLAGQNPGFQRLMRDPSPGDSSVITAPSGDYLVTGNDGTPFTVSTFGKRAAYCNALETSEA